MRRVAARPIAVLGCAALAAAAPARAQDEPDPITQRAMVLASVPYEAFLTTKRSHEQPFDWSADGCSHTPPSWARLFDGACQQHDFGYRNFGSGLELGRDEQTRARIDAQLLHELRRVCSQRAARTRAALSACRWRARLMWSAAQLVNDWDEPS